MSGKTVTRADLYQAIYQKVGLSRTQSAALVELVLKEITDCLERGETVKLSSFGAASRPKNNSSATLKAARSRANRRHHYRTNLIPRRNAGGDVQQPTQSPAPAPQIHIHINRGATSGSHRCLPLFSVRDLAYAIVKRIQGVPEAGQHQQSKALVRARAAAMRALSENVKDVEVRAMMLRLADDYDKPAVRAEDRCNGKATKQRR